MTTTSNSNENETPSMLSSHAQYAKGYVSSTIGYVTGSEEWKESGEKDMNGGVEGMKKASAANNSEPAASGIGGRIEELAGKAAGCEGMEKEGIERQEKA